MNHALTENNIATQTLPTSGNSMKVLSGRLVATSGMDDGTPKSKQRNEMRRRFKIMRAASKKPWIKMSTPEKPLRATLEQIAGYHNRLQNACWRCAETTREQVSHLDATPADRPDFAQGDWDKVRKYNLEQCDWNDKCASEHAEYDVAIRNLLRTSVPDKNILDRLETLAKRWARSASEFHIAFDEGGVVEDGVAASIWKRASEEIYQLWAELQP